LTNWVVLATRKQDFRFCVFESWIFYRVVDSQMAPSRELPPFYFQRGAFFVKKWFDPALARDHLLPFDQSHSISLASEVTFTSNHFLNL
jgi:hypothetical protein